MAPGGGGRGMRKILIIGIGAGNPDHLTVQAIAALNRADVLFIPDKGEEKADLRRLREDICARFIRDPGYRSIGFDLPRRRVPDNDYLDTVDDWHARIAERYMALFTEHLAPGETGALLVWGDPALYDSTLRIIDRIRATGFAIDHEVIPGISAVQALAASHRIPLNRIGAPVLLAPARRIADGLPETDVVVVLDGEQTFGRFTDAPVEIFWGAYLGTPDEIIVSGPLAEVADEITRLRAEARARKGWIMDTYLLRRTGDD